MKHDDRVKRKIAVGRVERLSGWCHAFNRHVCMFRRVRSVVSFIYAYIGSVFGVCRGVLGCAKDSLETGMGKGERSGSMSPLARALYFN